MELDAMIPQSPRLIASLFANFYDVDGHRLVSFNVRFQTFGFRESVEPLQVGDRFFGRQLLRLSCVFTCLLPTNVLHHRFNSGPGMGRVALVGGWVVVVVKTRLPLRVQARFDGQTAWYYNSKRTVLRGGS